MDHMRIIRRAFEITRRYRVLWVFGILLALTTSHGGGNSGVNYDFGEMDFRNGRFPFPRDFPQPSPELLNGLLVAGVALICFIILLAVAFTVVRYVAETAAIRMVDRYEAGGERVSFSEGWRLGWSRAAFRMWLVDLLFGVGAFILIVLLLAIAAAPLLLWTTGSESAGVVGTVMAVGLGVLVILLIILIAAVLSLLGQFFHRAIALENMGVFESIRRGWDIVRRRPGDVIIMGLILFGLGLLFTILMIPVVILLLAAGLVVGGLPALLVGLVTNLFAEGALPYVIGAVIGVPIFLAVMAIPLTFIGGLFEVFKTSTWTLTYREMLALESVQPA